MTRRIWPGRMGKSFRRNGRNEWTHMAERPQSAARDLGLSIKTDFIASPLHRFVRPFAADDSVVTKTKNHDSIRFSHKHLRIEDSIFP